MLYYFIHILFQPLLSQILNNGHGLLVQSYYDNHKDLNETSRDYIVTTVVNYCITNKIHMSTTTADNLADQIIQMYPSETKVRFLIRNIK